MLLGDLAHRVKEPLAFCLFQRLVGLLEKEIRPAGIPRQLLTTSPAAAAPGALPLAAAGCHYVQHK